MFRTLAIATALLAFVVSTPARAEEIAMKIATVAPDNTPWSELLKMYKKSVEEKSGGRIKVKVFLGGTLGDEQESVLKCKRGQIQAVGASTGAMAATVPELSLIELPYLFRSAKEADFVADTVLTPKLEPVFRGYGLVLGFWSENGFRQFFTKDKPVKVPADLKGKKMRSQESAVHLEMWKALGASPVPIPVTEVLTALGTGTVDGFDQALLFAIAANWFKSTKHATISDHIYQPAIIAYNKEWFDKLPADLQKVLIDEGRHLQNKGRKAVRNLHDDLVEVLKASGVTVTVLTPAEREVLEKATYGERAWFKKSQGKTAAGLLDAVEKSISEYRAGKVK